VLFVFFPVFFLFVFFFFFVGTFIFTPPPPTHTHTCTRAYTHTRTHTHTHTHDTHSGCCRCAGGGRAQAPHPACGGSPAPTQSEWSAYRVHFKDPLWFAGGVQLLARNGDVAGPVPYGSAKCMNLDMSGGGPGPSTVSTMAWVYEWD